MSIKVDHLLQLTTTWKLQLDFTPGAIYMSIYLGEQRVYDPVVTTAATNLTIREYICAEKED
jgi:hypothetical protein